MVHVVVDQRLLGIADRAFDRLQLLRDIETGLALLDHGANVLIDQRNIVVATAA